MKIKLKNFYLSVTFPSIALLAFIVISNFYTGYVLSFISILIHETGHLIVMFICRCKPDGFEISSFDIKIIKTQQYSLSLLADIFITLAGSVLNFIAFILFLSVYETFAYVNLFMGAFNLLPISTLDGGQLLFLFLSRKLTPDLSCKIIDSIAILISFPLFFIGLMILLKSKNNFSLLFLSIYMILSLFVKKDKIC